MLCRGDRVTEGGIHHDDALGCRCRNINVINANAGAADHLEAWRAFQQFCGGFGGRTDGEAIIIADDGGELVLVLAEAGIKGHIDAAILKNLHSSWGKGVRNENAWFGHRITSGCHSPKPEA